ncbi:43034_t:CDS:10 [Gigaspora margarita]|uniref:Protein HGH1 homolog n=1 Tax=Gigaspora margarita TaxID=4874 RepID=A0ABM8W065_GIGMA|nr:43034_t:CDS:10 [Gigaspora margarita]
MSILELQSSGIYPFECTFCLQICMDKILLIDIEGLGAPEKVNDKNAIQKDRLLATYVKGISNLTLINVLGEYMNDLTEILQIAIVAMVCLEEAEIAPDIFIIQNFTERNTGNPLQDKFNFVKEMDRRIQVGDFLKQIRPFKDDVPPSEQYYEDVTKLYENIIDACRQSPYNIRDPSSYEEVMEKLDSVHIQVLGVELYAGDRVLEEYIMNMMDIKRANQWNKADDNIIVRWSENWNAVKWSVAKSKTGFPRLLEFLHDGNPNVRQLALNHLLGYTVKSSQLQNIFKQNNMRPISDLKNICREDPVIAHDAFKALVNLVSDDEICKELNDDNFLHLMIKMITVHISMKFLKMENQQVEGLSNSTKAIDQLVDVFVRGLDRVYNKEAEYHFLASVFANVTMLPQGREYFLTTASYDDVTPLSKLIVFTEHPNIIRREHHLDMLSPSKINVLPYILLPLCGPEEFDLDDMEGMPEDIQLLPSDKKREPDAYLRQTLLESIFLLTTTRQGRMILRQKKVYPVIRQMHLVESDEKVSIVVEQVVNMLMRDEGPEEDNIVENIRSENPDLGNDNTIEEI